MGIHHSRPRGVVTYSGQRKCDRRRVVAERRQPFAAAHPAPGALDELALGRVARGFVLEQAQRRQRHGLGGGDDHGIDGERDAAQRIGDPGGIAEAGRRL